MCAVCAGAVGGVMGAAEKRERTRGRQQRVSLWRTKRHTATAENNVQRMRTGRRQWQQTSKRTERRLREERSSMGKMP